MQRYIFSLLMLLTWMGLYSCDDNSGGSDLEDLEVSQEIQEQAAFGYQINQIVGTGDEIGNFTNPQDVDEDDVDIPLATVSVLKDQANRMTREAKLHIANLPRLSKTSGDSLIFQHTDTSGTKITRVALYLDADSGLVRFEVVTSDSNPDRRVQYDSTSIVIDINDINDDSDDRFLSLFNFRRFAGKFIVQTITSAMIATDWDVEGEVTGFTATTTSTYNENRNLQKVISMVVLNPDENGTITQTFFFEGGETSVHSVTFNGDGTGTFSRSFRNGTTITGSFDDVEDDGMGSYQATTSFPSGFYLASIFKSASVVFDFIDKVMTGDYLEIVTFSDGAIDSVSMQIEVRKEDDYLVTTMDIVKSDGANGRLVIMKGDDLTVLNGTWTDVDNHYIIITAEYYADGSAWLKYEVYLNKTRYDAGANPIATGEYNFSPDGNGSGTLSSDGQVYEIDLKDGLGEIRQGGAKRVINLYR